MEEAQRPVCCQLNNTLTLDDFLLNIVVHIVSESLKVMNICCKLIGNLELRLFANSEVYTAQSKRKHSGSSVLPLY